MFYFYGIVIVLYNLLLYAIFRNGIYDYLRLSKMSKSNIKKNRKGLNAPYIKLMNEYMSEKDKNGKRLQDVIDNRG